MLQCGLIPYQHSGDLSVLHHILLFDKYNISVPDVIPDHAVAFYIQAKIAVNVCSALHEGWRMFKQSLIIPRGKKPSLRTFAAVIRIALTTDTNAKGTVYAKPTFELIGMVPEENIEGIIGYAESFKKAASRSVATQSDFIPVDSSDPEAAFKG